MEIFDKEFWISLQSDFTIHSLKRYQHLFKEGKCLFVNDGTTLFASKGQRAKDRLVGGLSELLSDGKYIYQDFMQKFTLEGELSLVINMTSESYQNYKNRLFGLTLSERFLTVHHTLTNVEQEEWVHKEERAKKIHFKEKITTDDIETEPYIPRKYFTLIKYLAREFSYASLRTFVGSQDLIKGILRAHASLNNRERVNSDDISFVYMIKDYLINPFSPYEGRIVKYTAQGFSVRDIGKKIGKPNYNQQIQRIQRKARLRGIIDADK